MALRILIVDAYAPFSRETFQQNKIISAGKLYQGMLERCSPTPLIYQIIYPANPDFTLPPDFDRYDGMAWTGSSLGLTDAEQNKKNPEIYNQLHLCQQAFLRGIPSFGSCWALQLAAILAGGTCRVCPKGREYGIARQIALTPEGRSHPMYHSKRSVFQAFINHGDEAIDIPETGSILAGNYHSRVQGIEVHLPKSVFWGVQYHPEYQLDYIAKLTHLRRDRLLDLGFFADHRAIDLYIRDLIDLYQNPDRSDLVWKYGMSPDILDFEIRTLEVKNWIRWLLAGGGCPHSG